VSQTACENGNKRAFMKGYFICRSDPVKWRSVLKLKQTVYVQVVFASWFCTVCVRTGILLMGSIAELLDCIHACRLSSLSSSCSFAV